MYTLILTLIISQPACSGTNCLGYSTIASIPGFDSQGLCDEAGKNWVQATAPRRESDSFRYVCVKLK